MKPGRWAVVFAVLAPFGAALPQQTPPTWKNLTVLSKDLTGAELNKSMKRYADELGVSCSFCHVQDDQTQKFDFVSDANPRKDTARIMISMLSDINNKYLARLGDRRYAVPITCGNCHQGQSSPPAYEEH